MDALGIVRRRLAEQRLAGEPFAGVGEAVGWFGAVQAQEYAEAKWSLAERVRSCADSDIEAAFTRGDIIRTHVLRPTWHFLASEDVRWVLRLTRPRVHALNRFHYQQVGLDAGVFAAGDAVLRLVLADGPQTRRELAGHFAAAGINTDSLRLGYLLIHAELEAVICSGPRRGKQQTYALLSDRVPPSPLDSLSGDEALDGLVLRYFRSHGPATVRDFAWWSSLTVADTKAALSRLGDALSRVEVEAGRAWYAAPVARALSPAAPGSFLIPTYDETIVAYQDLRVVFAHTSPQSGVLSRCIVIDGRTHGSWKRTISAGSVVVEALLFGALSCGEAALLDEAVARFGRFLSLPASLEITLAT